MSELNQTGNDDNYEMVSVRFDNVPKICFLNRNQLNVKIGELVIAETDRGEGIGKVVNDCCSGCSGGSSDSLKKLLRKATKKDIDADQDRKRLERKAFTMCKEKTEESKLEMNLIAVHYHFDRSKAVFYFTADGRIDFRELVKNLARELNTRIEMRQIGVRDKARLVGGAGCCGRELCCKSFLSDFEPVSVRMAKEQNLPLNPSKISGVCGRLMCCLTFEFKTYKQLCRELPKCGKKVQTKDGPGRVTRQNPLKGNVLVELDDGKEILVRPDDLMPNQSSAPDKNVDHKGTERKGQAPKAGTEKSEKKGQAPKSERRERRGQAPNRDRKKGPGKK